jgi:hypothetical protein
MNHRSRYGTWALALLVTGALLFGASALMATPADGATCRDDGWNWLGYQPTELACLNACLAVHPDLVDIQWGGQGCCTCLF